MFCALNTLRKRGGGMVTASFLSLNASYQAHCTTPSPGCNRKKYHGIAGHMQNQLHARSVAHHSLLHPAVNALRQTQNALIACIAAVHVIHISLKPAHTGSTSICHDHIRQITPAVVHQSRATIHSIITAQGMHGLCRTHSQPGRPEADHESACYRNLPSSGETVQSCEADRKSLLHLPCPNSQTDFELLRLKQPVLLRPPACWCADNICTHPLPCCRNSHSAELS